MMQYLDLTVLKLFHAVALISIVFGGFSCLADEKPAHLDHWKKIIQGDQPLDRPEGESWELSNKVKTFNEFDGKKILSFIREGDYVHAGEEEAIDLIMSFFPKGQDLEILDVACGFGGTADYIRKNGWGKVTGFDIEEESIHYAKTTYPQVQFFTADVATVSNTIRNLNFDLICIVNSFVCFPNQLQALKELRKLAKSTTNLLIFDYTNLITNNPLTGNGQNVSFLPIQPNEIGSLCNEAGWEITNYVTLNEQFEVWYKHFLDRIESKRNEIDERFGKNATNYTRGKYDLIYYAIKNKWIGGCLIILSPINK
jgi:ubiquinone/menaquinone biosynthesis C-methylase UbiE